jgi:hypothetical protein
MDELLLKQKPAVEKIIQEKNQPQDNSCTDKSKKNCGCDLPVK